MGHPFSSTYKFRRHWHVYESYSDTRAEWAKITQENPVSEILYAASWSNGNYPTASAYPDQEKVLSELRNRLKSGKVYTPNSGYTVVVYRDAQGTYITLLWARSEYRTANVEQIQSSSKSSK